MNESTEQNNAHATGIDGLCARNSANKELQGRTLEDQDAYKLCTKTLAHGKKADSLRIQGLTFAGC